LGVGSYVAGATSIPYACVTLDWWPEEKCDWGECSWARSTVNTLDLREGSDERAYLQRALAALSPVALRVGGTLQDAVSYDLRGDDDDDGGGPNNLKKTTASSSCGAGFQRNEDRVGFHGGCLVGRRYDELDDLARAAYAPMIFGLSGLHGRDRQTDLPNGRCDRCDKAPCEPCWTGVWRPKSAGGARALLERAASRARQNRSALAAVSLGNELCGIGGIAAHIPPEALARDFKALQVELDDAWREKKKKKRHTGECSSSFSELGPK